jgi:hypothetical protein
MQATCNTAGCENNGIPINVDTTDQTGPDGEVLTVGAVVCGPCGQPIADLV